MKKHPKAKKRKKHVKASTKSSGVTSLQSKVMRSSILVKNEADEDLTLLGYEGFVSFEQVKEYWLLGEWEKLVTFDLDFLQEHPDRSKLILFVASAYYQIGSISKAKFCFQQAIEWGCDKKLVAHLLVSGVYNALGTMLLVLKQDERARFYIRNAILYGIPSQNLQKSSELRYQQQEIFLKRRKAEYQNEQGEKFFFNGEFKEAVEYFQRAKEYQNSASYNLNIAEALARFEYEKDKNWSCKDIARKIDKRGKWDVVVRHYWEALKLDADIIKTQQAKLLKNIFPDTGNIDPPVFIVGCGHSGTSLMLALLGNHPNFYPIPKESALFLRTDSFIKTKMSEWDNVCKEQKKSRWVEKTPPHIFHIRRFLALRPKAKFILMLRDGRDVVCSLKPRTNLTKYSERLDRWIYDNMAALPYWEHPQVMVVKYENLVLNPNKILANICDFLDEEDYSDLMLDFYKTQHLWYSSKIEKPQAIKTHSDHMNLRNWQINQPLFDGRGRWKNEMSVDEKQEFKNSLAQKYLEQFGYVNDANW